MNFIDILIIVLFISILNISVYIIFKKYIYGKPDAAMKFLTINMSKDIVWLIVSLIIIEKTKENFLFIVICFVVASLLIYIPIIKLINKS
ncbi:hypothetical protein SAMN06264346_102125 [Chryseobacterium profundimaris]|uniref:Cation:proton antiporter n=1 Tax=Chryseobacterium profundimaris TaxID=1387275 RepID=A0ABY1NHC2_9FLAO|nr:hypothetical protein SAMN06264346_102125 [Chryseobacterium profundimaris]